MDTHWTQEVFKRFLSKWCECSYLRGSCFNESSKYDVFDCVKKLSIYKYKTNDDERDYMVSDMVFALLLGQDYMVALSFQVGHV